jgi:hypothetical protein
MSVIVRFGQSVCAVAECGRTNAAATVAKQSTSEFLIGCSMHNVLQAERRTTPSAWNKKSRLNIGEDRRAGKQLVRDSGSKRGHVTDRSAQRLRPAPRASTSRKGQHLAGMRSAL